MSAEGLLVSNPRGNNKNYEIHFVGRNGERKKFKTLKPGEACRVDKKSFTITERDRPPRLLHTEQGCVPDSGRG